MQPDRRKAHLGKQQSVGSSGMAVTETADVKLISMATYALLRVSEAAENHFEDDKTRH